MKTKLNITTKGAGDLSDYVHTAFNRFVEESVDSVDQDFLDRYQSLIDQLTDEKVNHIELMVDDDVLEKFIADLDERACLDYRENHVQDDEDLVRGGLWMNMIYHQIIVIHPQWAV